MSHSFEKPRPDHSVHHVRMPEGHGGSDQKLGKGMRSPMVSQLPLANGLESAELDQNLSGGEGSVGGGESY